MGRDGPADPTVDVAASWVRAARAVGASGDIAAVGARLLGAYAEEHRSYHDVRHLGDVLAAIGVLSPYTDRLANVQLAAWFHDAVYDPQGTDNEERSAMLAERELTALGVADDIVAEVARLVRVTATHEPVDAHAAVLCDADLAILASADDRYRSYVEGVRREYAHVANDVFTAGRSAILRRLLERDRIFHTEYAAVRWEARARQNVSAELQEIGDGI